MQQLSSEQIAGIGAAALPFNALLSSARDMNTFMAVLDDSPCNTMVHCSCCVISTKRHIVIEQNRYALKLRTWRGTSEAHVVYINQCSGLHLLAPAKQARLNKGPCCTHVRYNKDRWNYLISFWY